MREYDKDFKEEAIKLSCEIGPTAAAEKLGIPVTTLYTWRKNAKRDLHGENPKKDIQLYITSLSAEEADSRALLEIIRGQWSIENSLLSLV